MTRGRLLPLQRLQRPARTGSPSGATHTVRHTAVAGLITPPITCEDCQSFAIHVEAWTVVRVRTSGASRWLRPSAVPAARERAVCGARLAGLDRVSFMLELQRFDLSPIGVEPDELPEDVANA